ncbi:MAG: hypothetical protein IKS61_02390, partial [Aeriscardovia sp.]|nr:hypothetical protein [Aeriscardovia sp.]
METYVANNLLNTSDPANAQDPSVTPDAVIAFLEGKGIRIATAAKTEITNEVNNMLEEYDNRVGLVKGAPLARIFAIQIICMENTHTHQLVYPETFPQNMLDKDYSSEYQAEWNNDTSGKSYTLDAPYIWDSITYHTSNAIWEDPALNDYPWIIVWNKEDQAPEKQKLYSAIYSLNQIESSHLSSMKAEAGKINSLNLIGITQRAYAIKSGPVSLNFSKGYEESTGQGGDSNQTDGGMIPGVVVSPGSSDQAKFSMQTGPDSVSSMTLKVSLEGDPNASFNWNWNQTAGPGVQVSGGTSDGGRALALTIGGSGTLPAQTTFSFEDDVDVTGSSNESEVCAVAQGTSTGSLTLKSHSDTWCFAVTPISEKNPSQESIMPSSSHSSLPDSSTVSMIVPGWAFQYNGRVLNTLWSSIDGKDTSLSDYEAFQPTLPNLDSYDISDVQVTDLTTGEPVTSLFSISPITEASSFNTGVPYSNGQDYGGSILTPASVSVSWDNTWTGSAVSNSSLWGFDTTPIGFDTFEITFLVTLNSTSAAGGDIYTQATTSGPAATYSSSVYKISTPTSAPASVPSPLKLDSAGMVQPDGAIESSRTTATLGVPMKFEAEAGFPSASQISVMQTTGDALIFYSYDASSNVEDFQNLEVDGLSYNSLPIGIAQAQDGAVVLMFTPSDIVYIQEHAHDPSELTINYDWYVTSAPSYVTSEIGFVQGSSLNLSAPTYAPTFISSSAALNLTVNSNGTEPLAPNAQQSSALTGIWFQNQLLSGPDAKGAEFTVQNDTKGSQYYGEYLTPSSDGNPPYSYSSAAYDFKSTNGNGLFRMWGLANGTYKVTETKLPEGASGELPTFEVTLNWASDKPSSISASDPSSALVDGAADIVYNQVEGTASTTGGLPDTGGHNSVPKIILCIAIPL